MNDLQRVAFRQHSAAKGVARNDLPIELDDHASGSDLQVLEQPVNTQTSRELFFFSVDFDLHRNQKKPYPQGPPRGWPGNTVSSLPRALIGRIGAFTLTLPYAGATRIRFKGLPVLVRLSVCHRQTPLASVAPLTKQWRQVKFMPTFPAVTGSNSQRHARLWLNDRSCSNCSSCM